jgi:hypothetical protein
MNYSRLTHLILIISFCSTACDDKELSRQEKLLIGPTWIMIAGHDEYDGQWHEGGITDDTSTLEFYDDKRFRQASVGDYNIRVGTWTLSDDELHLIFHYENGQTGKFTFEIRVLTAAELQLAWIGRHGYVTEKYIPR